MILDNEKEKKINFDFEDNAKKWARIEGLLEGGVALTSVYGVILPGVFGFFNDWGMNVCMGGLAVDVCLVAGYAFSKYKARKALQELVEYNKEFLADDKDSQMIK